MKEWNDLSYLMNGNEKQKKCFEILEKLSILLALKEFHPMIVGTIPIEIDIDSSDLDIICSANDLAVIQNKVNEKFGSFQSFKDDLNKSVRYVASFEYDNLPIEIYAEKTITHNQYGFLHMVIEHRILELTPLTFREKIIQLKKKGFKTEPAFGKLLKLNNPYLDLIELNKLPDSDLELFLLNQL